MKRLFAALAFLSMGPVENVFAQADAPRAEITNGTVTAKFYLPDPQKGYYRGTRFDWSGQVYSLRTKNHEYFGQWFPRYDPKLHDAIMGPVEEFRTNGAGLGFDEAKAGENFIRIGVGVVKRPDERGYEAFRTYEIVDPGTWSVKVAKDRITFVQDLRGSNGYAYRYTKRMRLVGKRAEMAIEHELKNTGKRAIQTEQYNHNFFVIDGQPTGPQVRVETGYALEAKRPFAGGLAESRGREIRYNSELKPGQSTIAEFAGGSPYDFRLEHAGAGAGVRITGDQPVAKLVYWSIRTTFCPEPYIALSAAPGKSVKWRYLYEFYDLPKR